LALSYEARDHENRQFYGAHPAKELINRLGLAEGDAVIISEKPTGFSVSRTDPAFEKGLKIARRAMKTYRNALSTLAK
jgi:hypothetical protein